MGFQFFLFSLMFFIIIFLVKKLVDLDFKIDSLNLHINSKDKTIGTLRETISRCVTKEDYNKLVRKANKIISDLRSNGTFTNDDLKRLKHYIHPDKHNGKTNDLFIKVSKVLNDKSK